LDKPLATGHRQRLHPLPSGRGTLTPPLPRLSLELEHKPACLKFDDRLATGHSPWLEPHLFWNPPLTTHLPASLTRSPGQASQPPIPRPSGRPPCLSPRLSRRPGLTPPHPPPSFELQHKPAKLQFYNPRAIGRSSSPTLPEAAH
jgi:hypothetical protein